MNIFQHLAAYTNSGIPVVIVTVTEKKGDGPVEIGKKMIVTNTDIQHGTVGGGALEYEAREHCKTIIKTRKSVSKTYLLKEGKEVKNSETLPMECGGIVTLFFEYIGPLEFVYIFGAGHVGQALTNVLTTMNFHVTVIDNRKDICDTFIGGDEVICTEFATYFETHEINSNSFVVVTTPSHKYDYSVINQIIERDIKLKYMGMICSKPKLKNFLQKAEEKFGSGIDLSNFYSPIGLDLGGGSPAEIAISIASEILAIHHEKPGHKHMREVCFNGENYNWKD